MGIPVAGSLGLGLVWGWLIAGPAWAPRHPLRTFVALTGATLLVALEVDHFVRQGGLEAALLGTILALTTHLVWMHGLNRRAGSLR
jgi:hypothetical protein